METGCFHILAIVNRATIHIEVHASLGFFVCLLFFLCYVLAYQLTIYTRLLRIQINIQMKRHVGQIPKQGIRYLRGSFWIRSFFGYMPKSGITGLYGNSILHFWRNSHIIFHSGSTKLLFHQHCRRVLFHSHSLQHSFADFLKMAVLTNVKCYLIVVLTCMSLIIYNVENLFMYLMSICIYLWRNVYFGILSFLKNWVVCFCYRADYMF